MEVIRIPQVSLVDATGRRIGVYTEDPDWWQQLKSKHDAQKSNSNQLAIQQESNINKTELSNINAVVPRQLTPINNSEFESTSNIRARLIKDESFTENNNNNNNKNMNISTIQTTLDNLNINQSSNLEDSENQCNVIGETPLHIAIMYDDFNTIKYLIETKGFDVNSRNVGGKFTGGFNSKMTANLIQESKYEGLAYYGEYPLAFAACFASKEIYDYLIEKGADPNLKDSNGNTVLHVLVINNKLDMFQYATNHQTRKALLTIKNNQDLTPINLAAKLGRKDLFEKILELRNIEFWRYSNITCSAYPLEGLDTIDADGKIAWNAALSYIVNGGTEDHLDMLEIGVVKRLLGDKWSTYAQRRLFKKLVISIIHLIFLSIAVYTRAGDSEKLAQWPPGSANTWVRYISEIAVLIGCLAILFLQAQEIYAQGFIYYLKNLAGEPANVFYVIFCILILIALPFRFIPFTNADGTINNRNVEDTFVILAIPCGWFHLLFYARVINLTGPFVVMIYKMIIGDILTFASIYILLLFGFSLGFYYLYKNYGGDTKSMHNFPESILLSFQMTLGEFKARLPEFDQIYYSDFVKVVFLVFMILMHILLLNMLIAMMGNTYHQIIKKSEKEWRRQWAQVVILLERSFSPKELQKFQNQYSIKLPSKDPKNKPEVGLMVIKKVAKTKAFQKTTCIRNWKKFCKSVLALLKENSFKADQLLKMWANKDVKVIKAKRIKKEFSWSNYGGKFSKQNSLTAINTNNTNLSQNENTNSISNNNNNNNSKKPPLPPEPLKIKYSLEQNNQSKKQKESLKSNEDAPDNDAKKESKSKLEKQKTVEESSSGSRPSSEINSDYTHSTSQSNQTTVLNRFNLHKKTFYPNQTSKIYPVGSNTFISDANTNDQSNIKPGAIGTINPVIDFSDLKRPLSSTLQKPNSDNSYIKKDSLPKFAQKQLTNLFFQNSDSKSTDENMSIDSDNGTNIFKLRNSPDDSNKNNGESNNNKNKQNESQI